VNTDGQSLSLAAELARPNEGRYSLIQLLFAGWRLVARVSNAVAKDALCVNNMECCGKCVSYTLTAGLRITKDGCKIFQTYVSQSVSPARVVGWLDHLGAMCMDLLCVCLDHPQTVFAAVHHCTKYG